MGTAPDVAEALLEPQQEVLQVVKFIAEIQCLPQSWTVCHSECHKSMQSSPLVKFI